MTSPAPHAPEQPLQGRGPSPHTVLRRRLLAGSAVAAAAFGVLLVFVVARAAPLLTVDRDVVDGLHRVAVRHPGYVAAVRVITTMGAALTWLIILTAFAGVLLMKRQPVLAVFVLVTWLGSWGLNNLVKHLVGRTRPVFADPVASATGPAFPSGHAQAAVVGCGVVLIAAWVMTGRIRPSLWFAAWVVIVAVGYSRVALGVHYLSDVVGSALIGTAWLLGAAAIFVWRGRGLGEHSESSAKMSP